MGDISFFGGGGQGGGSGGVSNYNELTNKPVSNITGNPVIISSLSTGIYNINGTWTLIEGAEVYDTPADDLFYVTNDENGCRLTRVSADGVYNATLPAGGSAGDVSYDTVATVNEAVGEVMENLWGEF